MGPKAKSYSHTDLGSKVKTTSPTGVGPKAKKSSHTEHKNLPYVKTVYPTSVGRGQKPKVISSDEELNMSSR